MNNNQKQDDVSRYQLRITIRTYFIKVLGQPSRKFWFTKDGGINKTLQVFNLPYSPRRYIIPMLGGTISGIAQSIPYSGSTKAQLRLKGPPPSIHPGSEESLNAD